VDDKTGKKLVNSRDLHVFFESKYAFSTWIHGKIKKHKFKPLTDYILVHYDKKGNIVQVDKGKLNRYKVECALTFEAAKRLAMAQNSEKAEPFREYLANIDKKYEDLKKTGLKSTKTYTMSEVADILQLEDYSGKIGRNGIYRILKDKGILDIKNKPLLKYVKSGYFDTKVVPYVVTQSGFEWLSTSILILKSKVSTAVAPLTTPSNVNTEGFVSISEYNKLVDKVDKLLAMNMLFVENILIAKSGSKTSEHQSHELIGKFKSILSLDSDQKALKA